VSHADGTKVIPDQKGNVHTISNLVSPVSCSDDSGNDCLSAISKNDGDIWVQKWEDTNSNDDLYDEMTLTFPASSSSKVKIVYYGRKSTFLADSWENILGLVGGNNMPAFINLLKTSPLVDYLVTSLREDKGKLHFYTSDCADWNEQAAVYIGGQRSYWNVVELNVVPNEPIKVKIKEFVGTFTLDSVGIDYSEDNILNMKELPLNSAYKDGIDVSEKIRSNDKQYVETEKGDEVYLTFVDESKDDVSYVFEVGGYYVPIIKNRTFPDIKTLLEILTDDRKLVDYVVPEYIEQGGFAFE
jgi:hypothetical protein